MIYQFTLILYGDIFKLTARALSIYREVYITNHKNYIDTLFFL